MIQRVIDITKTDPQVLTWAITRQARLLGPGEDANQMIDEALEVIKKVAIFQKEVSKIEHDGRMIKYGSTERLDQDKPRPVIVSRPENYTSYTVTVVEVPE